MRKINVYVNNKYQFSTVKYKTCREVLESLKNLKSTFVAGRRHTKGSDVLNFCPDDKITASFL